MTFTVEILLRLLLSAVLGGLIGVERGRHGRAAGLRTHVLVCLGAALITAVGLYTVQELGFSADPLRAAAQVISGIGFLGAGTILTRNHTHVTGLTTAAGLWATACLGLAVGAGLYSAAVVGWLVIMVTITVLTRLERRSKQLRFDTYYLELNDITRVNEFSREMGDIAITLQIIRARSGVPSHIGLELVSGDTEHSEDLLEQLRALPYVVIAIPTTELPG